MAKSVQADFVKAIYGRLSEASAITALVPSDNIAVGTSIPPAYPALCIRPGNVAEGVFLARNDFTGYLDLHIWAEKPGFGVATAIEAAIRQTLKEDGWTFDTHHVADLTVDATHYLVDPADGSTHVVMTLRAKVVEAD